MLSKYIHFLNKFCCIPFLLVNNFMKSKNPLQFETFSSIFIRIFLLISTHRFCNHLLENRFWFFLFLFYRSILFVFDVNTWYLLSKFIQLICIQTNSQVPRSYPTCHFVGHFSFTNLKNIDFRLFICLVFHSIENVRFCVSFCKSKFIGLLRLTGVVIPFPLFETQNAIIEFSFCLPFSHPPQNHICVIQMLYNDHKQWTTNFNPLHVCLVHDCFFGVLFLLFIFR